MSTVAPAPRSAPSAPPPGLADPNAERYLALLRRSLTHTAYTTSDVGRYPSGNPLIRSVTSALRRRHWHLIQVERTGGGHRDEGTDWPLFAQTMVGTKRLEDLQRCVEAVVAEGVPGDLIETGVWRGGASLLMKATLDAHGDSERHVVLADSFRGLPPADYARYPKESETPFHAAEQLAISVDEVRASFRLHGLLDERVEFLEGWFSETLPTVDDDRRFALVRLDGDMYESTMDGLRHLYPKLSPGGFLVVDDYSIEACAAAVEDYRAEHGITEPLHRVDWTARRWRKPA